MLDEYEKFYTFIVQMNCSGCSGAIERALRKLNTVTNVEISLKDQTVKVYGNTDIDVLFETIQKTGKHISWYA